MTDYQAQARALKADAIADTLYDLGRRGGIDITLEYVESVKANLQLRDYVAHAAHQRPASDDTWDVVIGIVTRRGACWPHAYEPPAPHCQRCGYDPFVNLPETVDRTGKVG